MLLYRSTLLKNVCIRDSNSFDPDQTIHYVRLDLGLKKKSFNLVN